MIGLDTNILARYYVDDDADAETAKQQEAARRLIDGGEALMVSKTVLLELDWVMRGYYRIGPRGIRGQGQFRSWARYCITAGKPARRLG